MYEPRTLLEQKSRKFLKIIDIGKKGEKSQFVAVFSS